MIDLDWTCLNERGRSTVCRFGILERVTERGLKKLYPLEVNDDRLGRFSIFNEQDESFLPASAQ